MPGAGPYRFTSFAGESSRLPSSLLWGTPNLEFFASIDNGVMGEPGEPVPEPGSLVLLVATVLSLAAVQQRRMGWSDVERANVDAENLP